MIQLTMRDGLLVLVNEANIVTVVPYKGGSQISFIGDADNWISVNETFGEIKSILEENE